MPDDQYLISGPIPGDILAWELSNDHLTTNAGAIAFFLGRVRNDDMEGKQVSGIEYSAYPEMIVQVIQGIRDRLFNEFSDLFFLKILHSTGLVRCGEISLLVMVCCGHRQQSFSSLEKCVQLIKEDLPVWKKELFTDGTSRWI